MNGNQQALFLRLVHDALRGDNNYSRLKAFAKRILQGALQSSAGYAGASVLLVTENLSSEHPDMLKSFVAVGDDNTETSEQSAEDAVAYFNISSRDPAFAHAEESSLWELCLLGQHFHPSVSKFSVANLQKGDGGIG
eukprot:Plantae.Rhodophyta-Rhodochaete_pulchella.ctg41533.p2 GENE.Plantae.Rhodophyta-Rhodochaete_pulchella.ctg41533~~Plantae.Rhodophyta-Rhodochaete_pulchella.ctg41533.p2  ORF type:complete len:137 (+),score=24.83 Plantae.Rhodophyta-Rhodochaete_pulchella.ctg41533:673-1083(+)